MKKTAMILVLFVLGCQKKESKFLIPQFKGNFTLRGEGFLQDLAKEKDFSVVYSYSDGWSIETSVKAFSLKNNVWEKIELRKGITEVDSILNNAEITVPTDVRGVDTTFIGSTLDIVEKEVRLKKACIKQEAENFLNELIRNGLFELPEERELLEKCRQQRADKEVPSYTDIGYVSFYIIQGVKIRLLNYQTYQRNQDCPSISEWSKVGKIQQVFEKNWYRKRHY